MELVCSVKFSQEDYAGIAAELYLLMVAKAVPVGYQKIAEAAAKPAPAPEPAPEEAVPSMTIAISYQTDAKGRRIDDIMPKGTPGTVCLKKTGNVLSVPQPKVGELWKGYLVRVHRQCGASAPMVALDVGPEVALWPLEADRIYNAAAYSNGSPRNIMPAMPEIVYKTE